MAPIEALGDYVDGLFVKSKTPARLLEVKSPADLDDFVGAFPIDPAHVDAAVDAARAAQPAWERTPLADRMAALRRLGTELKAREAELVKRIGREVGKPAWEAKTEIAALGSKIQITLDEGLPLVKGFSHDGGKLETRYRPHGVLAVLGPFNFPLHLAHGHIVPALATGNTVVFKPSEVAPATAQIYAEAFHAANLPPGVFNLVQGAGPEGARLSAHAGIDGVLFTGSYETGVRIIKANADRPGRLLALELGGKNAAVVLADAPLDKAVFDVTYSAFVTAGQRCTAVSRVIVERSISDAFIAQLVARTRRLVVGHPEDPAVFMGPIATKAGFERFHAARGHARREKAQELLESHVPRTGRFGYYATPSIHHVWVPDPHSLYQHEEVFGPELSVYVADSVDEALALADGGPFGLAAAVFTQSEAKFDEAARRLRVGCLTWNAPTVGSSSRLPFGGVKHSGNHRPAALFSTLYCTYPVAVTRGEAHLDGTKVPPGMA